LTPRRVSAVLPRRARAPDTQPATRPIAGAEVALHTRHVANSGTEHTMLHYALVFLVIALIAALFGFGGIAASAVGIAKILFIVFAVLAVATFLFGLIRKS